MGQTLLLIFFSFFLFQSVQAQDPVEPVDTRAQLCTELENFFRTTPTGTPETLGLYFRAGNRNPNLLNPFNRGRRYPTVFRQLSEASRRGQLSQSCMSIIPVTEARRARGSAQAMAVSRGVEAPAEVLDGKRHVPVTRAPVTDDVIDYCVERNNCRLQETLTGVESQGQTICNISQSIVSPQTSVEEQNQCSCLRDLQALQCTPYDAAAVSETVNNAVLQTLGQNFLNSYAQLREDTNFYENRIIGNSGTGANEFSCSSFAGFERRVRSECRGQANSEARMQTILNSFSNLQPGTAASMFAQTNNQILNVPSQTGINRGFADFNRQILSSVPELRAVEKMIQDCLKGGPNLNANEWIRERVQREAGQPAPMPFEKMAQLLRRKAFENPAAFISRYLDRAVLGDSYQAFVDYINNPANRDADVSTNIFQTRMLQLMTGHPGFDNLLSNEKYAKRVASRIPAADGGVRTFLEGSESGMPEEFISQCAALQENFANLVCASDRELLGQISRSDIQDAVSENAVSETSNPQNVDRLRCQVTGTLDGPTEGVFERIMNAPADSDYYQRLMSPVPRTSMTRVADNLERNREAYTRSLARGMAAGGNTIRAYTPVDDPMAEALFSEFPELSAGQISSDIIASKPVIPAINSTTANTAERAVEPVMRNSPEVNSGITPPAVMPPIIPTMTQPPESESKRALRDSLTGAPGQETINQLVSNIDDGAATELARLREELTQSRQREIDSIDSRTQQLTQKIRSLEREQTVLRDQAGSISRPEESTPVSRGPASTNTNGRVFSSPNSNQGTTSGSTQSIQDQVPTDSGVNAARAAALSPRAVSPGSLRAGGIVVSNNIPAASGGPVTVETSSVAAVNGDVPPEDVNRNILSYLESNALDLRTLIQIKESGMLFRYRVNEQGQTREREILLSYANLAPDIRNIIDQRILRAQSSPGEVQRISSEIRLRRRNYSYETLRAIIISSSNGTLR